MKRLTLAVSLLTAAAVSPAAAAEPVRIAVLDTGINAAHQEFAPGQLVGYWDFTGELPEPGQLFDPDHPVEDDNGHGTLTSSMAAGLNVAPEKTPSFAPGYELAMADVSEGGAINGDLAAAIRWSVETVGADVINISIGSIVPIPGAPLLFEEYVALREAREKGVLVTVANGNGTGNAGLVPGDGASSFYASSTDVLAVGASGLDGATVSYQPEVAAQYTVTGPTHDSTDQYTTAGGTSFASPLTAGFAARVLTEARAAGRTLTATELEDIVKLASRDTEMPPVWEGYGTVDAEALPAALEAARTGTPPTRPSPDASALYVEQVAGTERRIQTGELPGAR